LHETFDVSRLLEHGHFLAQPGGPRALTVERPDWHIAYVHRRRLRRATPRSRSLRFGLRDSSTPID
jgi:hypothetical protein